MARQHGITTNTYRRFIIDSGALYLNYGETSQVLLGATRGGSTFSIEQEIREMEVDGAKGPVVGSKRVIRSAPMIKANFVEMGPSLLSLGIPGSSVADYPVAPGVKTHDQITRALQIAASDYNTNIAIIGECTGSSTGYIECIISNPLANGNIELGFADNDESVLAVEFIGHFAVSDLNTEPWKINFPILEA
jgi:hypothetical protein